MKNFQFYDTNEIIALIVSVLIGTGAYLGFIILKKHQKANAKLIFWVLLINLFVTYLVSEALKIFKWGEYRTLILPLVAYAGQYFTDWLDKRYLKLFDSGAGKIGLDIKDSDEENYTEEPEEPENINIEKDG